MQALSNRALARIVPLVCAIIVVSIGAYFVGNNAISHMLRANVEANARNWGGYIVKSVPNLSGILAGTQSPQAAEAYFQGKRQAGSIDRYRIYDVYGQVRADSGNKVENPVRGGRGQPVSETARKVAETGESDYSFGKQQIGGQVRDIAHIFSPLIMNGETVGTIEILSDETTTWEMLQGQFKQVAAQSIALIVFAFGLPGILYLRRTGQLEFAALDLKRSSETDDLTGALNRSTFGHLLADQLATAAGTKISVAVHFIDLDRFKDVNDMRGHAVGDEVLRQATVRLRRTLGIRERLARLGGDEFAICQPYRKDNPEVVAELANDIARAMAKPFYIGDIDIQIGATVGFARYPLDGATAEELIRSADIALYTAKTTMRGKAMPFDMSMEAERKQRQYVENRLRTALARKEFEIHYQPLYETSGKHLRGFEALLRLKDENGAPISPAKFIPIAEETGLIGDIGAWVLKSAAQTACEWPDDLIVSVNLSPAQFKSHEMPKVVQSVLKETGLPARRLELEVTEGLLIDDTDRVLAELSAIKKLGVSIALDDFGTGYSSLSYLWQFPFDKLKVDKSFMSDLTVDGSKSREILSTIVALGRVLDLKITAEGVETEEQAALLRELDCDLIQGYLYGRPMTPEDVGQVLALKMETDTESRDCQELRRSA